ncbi:MAG: transposase [Parcubacteria group bacterium]|nr:transposase [Parcubacteria group bacterium]
MSRIVGIRHRVKKTAEGEARPTQVCLLSLAGERLDQYDLPDDTAELDWVLGRFPIKYRKVKPEEDFSVFLLRHIKRRKLRKTEKPSDFLNRLVRKVDGQWFLTTQVPSAYDGFSVGDRVAMVLGGSGDRLAYALSRKGEEMDASVFRIPPFTLKESRPKEKDEDAWNLGKLLHDVPEFFYPVNLRDRRLILLRQAFIARTDAMKERIACEQRLYQHLIGRVFCSEDGLYAEGGIEELYTEAKASDVILQALLKEEKAREKELVTVVENLNVYQKIFEPVTGVGPMLAARLIVAIGDIRRFKTKAKLKAFCGAHLLADGRFPRLRSGQVANWHPDARQALYLLGDQFNYRADSVWGKKLREYKVHFREVHPEVEMENGKQRYNDAHIHRMATWRTLTKFVEWLWSEWWKLEDK